MPILLVTDPILLGRTRYFFLSSGRNHGSTHYTDEKMCKLLLAWWMIDLLPIQMATLNTNPAHHREKFTDVSAAFFS